MFRRHHPCTNVCHNGSISIQNLYSAFRRCHLTSKETLSHKHYVAKVNQFQASPRHWRWGDVILQCTNVCRNGGISILTLYPAFGRCHLTSKELLSHKHYVTKVNNFKPALVIVFGRRRPSMHQPVSQWQHFHNNSARGSREMPPKQRNAFS